MMILRGVAYTERNGTYVNTEGRVQRGRLAVFGPGEAKEDWAIVRALSDVLGKTLPYDNLSQVRARMVEINGLFANVDAIQRAEWKAFGEAGKIAAKPFVSIVRNYYMTDPISRASETMAACTAEILGEGERTGTDG